MAPSALPCHDLARYRIVTSHGYTVMALILPLIAKKSCCDAYFTTLSGRTSCALAFILVQLCDVKIHARQTCGSVRRYAAAHLPPKMKMIERCWRLPASWKRIWLHLLITGRLLPGLAAAICHSKENAVAKGNTTFFLRTAAQTGAFADATTTDR